MKRWLAIVPVGALVAFGVIAAGQLINPKKGDFKRNLRSAPDTAFPTLDSAPLSFAPSPTGGTIAVNLFASWCAPCVAELKEFTHRHAIAQAARVDCCDWHHF